MVSERQQGPGRTQQGALLPRRCQVYGTELPGRTRGVLEAARIPFALPDLA